MRDRHPEAGGERGQDGSDRQEDRFDTVDGLAPRRPIRGPNTNAPRTAVMKAMLSRIMGFSVVRCHKGDNKVVTAPMMNGGTA